jgi:hypothetical protein
MPTLAAARAIPTRNSAHAHSAVLHHADHVLSQPAFNSAFYVTAAAVIPLLFLTIAFQTRTLDDLLDEYVARVRRHFEVVWPQVKAGKAGLGTALGALMYGYAPVVLSSAILCAGVFGEIFALLALYRQNADSSGPYILYATIVLVVFAAIGPMRAFVRAGRRGDAVRKEILAREDGEAARNVAASRDQQGSPPTVEPDSDT